MSVLVKGMSIPDNCESCRFETGFGFCLAKSDNFCGYTNDRKRPDWCPLVEVREPHEKLVEFIDVATFEDEDSGTKEVNLGEVFAAYLKMRESKPIIEAEGE